MIFFWVFKNYFVTNFLAPYGTTMSRMPTNMGRQQQGFMMDPHAGKLKVPSTYLKFEKALLNQL